MAEMQFKDIKKEGVIMKKITAKVCEVNVNKKKDGQEYLKVLLGQRKSKIVAMAYNHICQKLKTDIQIGSTITFPGSTFVAKKRDKKYKSESTNPFDLRFLKSLPEDKKSPVKDPNKNEEIATTSKKCTAVITEIETAIKKIKGRIAFSLEINGIIIVSGKVYRYLGCAQCTSSIKRPSDDGLFYCMGKCKRDKKLRKKGYLTERKSCMIIHGFSVSDSYGHIIEDIVVYDNGCQKLFGKSGDSFSTDNEPQNIIQAFIDSKTCINFRLKRSKNKSGSKFPPSVVAEGITLPQGLPILQSTNFTDQGNDFGPKKDEKRPSLKLTRLDVKVNLTPSNFKLQKRSYEINTKPRGIVLIINNENYPHRKEPKDRVRTGSEVDVDYLIELFTELKFEIFEGCSVKNLKNINALEETLKRYKKSLIFNQVDSAIVVILGHGSSNEIELTGHDPKTNKANLFKDVVLPFSDKKFKEFIGRPKLFILEACQGFDTSEYTRDLTLNKSHLSDAIICYPALPGFEAHRNSVYGSVFIHFLVKAIMENACGTEFLEILTIVNNEIREAVKKDKAHHISQTFCIPLYFSPFYFMKNPADRDEPMEISDRSFGLINACN